MMIPVQDAIFEHLTELFKPIGEFKQVGTVGMPPSRVCTFVVGETSFLWEGATTPISDGGITIYSDRLEIIEYVTAKNRNPTSIFNIEFSDPTSLDRLKNYVESFRTSHPWSNKAGIYDRTSALPRL